MLSSDMNFISAVKALDESMQEDGEDTSKLPICILALLQSKTLCTSDTLVIQIPRCPLGFLECPK